MGHVSVGLWVGRQNELRRNRYKISCCRGFLVVNHPSITFLELAVHIIQFL